MLRHSLVHPVILRLRLLGMVSRLRRLGLISCLRRLGLVVRLFRVPLDRLVKEPAYRRDRCG